MRGFCKAATALVTGIAALGAVGCNQGGEERLGEDVAYVVFDRSAREAGVRIDGVDTEDAVLPVEISAGAQQHLVGPAGRVPLSLQADDVIYVRGREARVERGTLDVEVARDRAVVVGAKSAAMALADEVQGVVDEVDGRFVVVGPDALRSLARAATPDGIDEIVPVKPDDHAGRPAFGPSFQAGPTAINRFHPSRDPLAKPFEIDDFVRSRLAERSDEILPEAIDCDDPVIGTWVSREHYPEHGDWYRFELVVRRDERDPGQLLGVVTSRSWSGTSDRLLPGVCSSDEASFDWSVRMSAVGVFDGSKLSFDGRGLDVEGTRCGPTFQASRYNIDHFTGHLLEGGRYLTAVNNDGDRAVDEPHVFRRISCR